MDELSCKGNGSDSQSFTSQQTTSLGRRPQNSHGNALQSDDEEGEVDDDDDDDDDDELKRGTFEGGKP